MLILQVFVVKVGGEDKTYDDRGEINSNKKPLKNKNLRPSFIVCNGSPYKPSCYPNNLLEINQFWLSFLYQLLVCI